MAGLSAPLLRCSTVRCRSGRKCVCTKGYTHQEISTGTKNDNNGCLAFFVVMRIFQHVSPLVFWPSSLLSIVGAMLIFVTFISPETIPSHEVVLALAGAMVGQASLLIPEFQRASEIAMIHLRRARAAFLLGLDLSTSILNVNVVNIPEFSGRVAAYCTELQVSGMDLWTRVANLARQIQGGPSWRKVVGDILDWISAQLQTTDPGLSAVFMVGEKVVPAINILFHPQYPDQKALLKEAQDQLAKFRGQVSSSSKYHNACESVVDPALAILFSYNYADPQVRMRALNAFVDKLRQPM